MKIDVLPMLEPNDDSNDGGDDFVFHRPLNMWCGVDINIRYGISSLKKIASILEDGTLTTESKLEKIVDTMRFDLNEY